MLSKTVFVLVIMTICMSSLMAILGYMGVSAILMNGSFGLLCLGLIFYFWSLYDNKK